LDKRVFCSVTQTTSTWGGKPVKVADALTAAPDIYGDVGLSIGWGLKKTELYLPSECDPEELPIPCILRGVPLLDIVEGFKACLGVPRHHENDKEFIMDSLRQVGDRHDSLLELVGDVSEETHLRRCGSSKCAG
jgi:hypothetical protein